MESEKERNVKDEKQAKQRKTERGETKDIIRKKKVYDLSIYWREKKRVGGGNVAEG